MKALPGKRDERANAVRRDPRAAAGQAHDASALAPRDQAEKARTMPDYKRDEAAALRELRTALARGRVREIGEVYDRHAELLRTCHDFTAAERQRVRKAQDEYRIARFKAAIKSGDLDRIVAAGDVALAAGCVLDADALAALRVAGNIRVALEQFEAALSEEDDLAIVRAYDAGLLDGLKQVSAKDRQRLGLARRRVERWRLLRIALARDDDRRIALYYDPDMFEACRLLSPAEQERCRLATQRVKALAALEEALAGDDDEAIAAAYDEQCRKLLAGSGLVTARQQARIDDAGRRQLAVADFTEALADGDLDRIAEAYAQATGCGARLPECDWTAILEGIGRRMAIEEFHRLRAAGAGERSEAVCRGRRLLELAPPAFLAGEQEQVLDAFKELGAAAALGRAIRSGDPVRIRATYRPDLLGQLSNEEQRRVEQALLLT